MPKHHYLWIIAAKLLSGPPSWFLTTPTDCSASKAAGLLHPAHGHGVHRIRGRKKRSHIRRCTRSLSQAPSVSLRPPPRCCVPFEVFFQQIARLWSPPRGVHPFNLLPSCRYRKLVQLVCRLRHTASHSEESVAHRSKYVAVLTRHTGRNLHDTG
jgi:hypothetical protein